MALIGTINSSGDRTVWTGISGVNDNDIAIETEDISRVEIFQVSCNSGSFDVFVYDGNQWLTAPLSIADLGATSVDPVIVGVGLRAYGFRGFWSKIRIRQAGDPALLGATLRALRNWQ